MIGLLVVGGLCVLPGCQEDATAVLVEVRTRTQISKLFVSVKQYHEDGQVTLYSPFDTEIPETLDGYVVTVNTDPIRLNIELPGPGSYAIHIVAIPLAVSAADPNGDRLIATVCHDVADVTLDDDVYLGRLTADLDVDRDTFPENSQAFCDFQADSGLPCDTSCNSAEFMAMVDCNPAPDIIVPEDCGEVGPPTAWNPFANDFCEDCHNQDCYNGDAPCIDRDGDGHTERVDCDDNDPTINLDADEICGNDIDENCRVDVEGCDSGDRPCDADGDGFLEQVSDTCGRDCDDTDAQVSPHAYEGRGADPDRPEASPGCGSGEDTFGDGIDNNCNGRVDEGCFSNDIDDDGVTNDIDCNDCNAGVGPGFAEICDNDIDEDCDGADLPCDPNDTDGDGFSAEPVGSDCNDADAHTYPGASDYCDDGFAQDCSLELSCSSITDEDGDRFGAEHGDCDDLTSAVNPWAVEECDTPGVDEDCDGLVNEIEDPEVARRQGCGYDRLTETWDDFIYDDDLYNCGECGHICCPNELFRCEGEVCNLGVCQCGGGAPCPGTFISTCCYGACVDITSREEHCGECGHQCAIGDEICSISDNGRGECSCPHQGGEACPDEYGMGCCPVAGCTNVHSDPENCGACGTNCTSGPRPLGDICALSSSGIATCYCQSQPTQCYGDAWCTGVADASEGSCGCHDLTSEFDNCGRCGEPCDTNEECQESRCVCPGDGEGDDCDGTETDFCCPDGCVDRLSDEENCGICGLHCYPGELCEDGVCICGPGPCDDVDSCTEDYCQGGRCVHRTEDADDDGYCAPGCSDGGRGDCNDTAPDCDESRATVNPGATETCATAYDDNCNGDSNDLNATGCTSYFPDTDHDTFGDSSASSRCYCTPRNDYSATNADDCDDSLDTVNPSAAETCFTSYDDDCDGDSNDLNAAGCTNFNYDEDDDTYGTSATECHCSGSGHFTAPDGGDCNDSNATINPGAPERCTTGADDDCDGDTNDLDAVGCTTRYQDGDDDGYGRSDRSECRCIAVGSYDTTSSGDCEDDDPSINPGADDVCNGVDDDCNGGTADGLDECGTRCCGSPPSCRQCCDSSDCGTGDWSCSSYSCSCSGQICGDRCYGSGDCCDVDDCGTNESCNGSHLCVCDDNWRDCGGSCNCHTSDLCCGTSCETDGDCCEDSDCVDLFPGRADNCHNNWCECYFSNQVCATDECCCSGRCESCPC